MSYVHILDNTNEQNTLYLKSVSADEIILKQASADRIITFNDSTATIHFGEGNYPQLYLTMEQFGIKHKLKPILSVDY